LDTLLNLSPADFQSTYLLHEMLTLQELNKHISDSRARGIEKVEIFLIQKYTIFTYPFAIIILTMIGVIVSARKSRGGAGFQIALGFLIAFVYIIFVVMSRSIAQAGSMDPLIAVLLPNIIFSVIGVVMYYTVPR
jgi:lipopolysaccharide export system permease protein